MTNQRISLTKAFWVLGLAISGARMALASAELTLIGTFGDWTAYELKDAQSRICFAETRLADQPVPDKSVKGVRLMVTHQAMGYGGEMVRVSIDEAPFEGAHDIHLRFRDDWRGHAYDFSNNRGLPRWSDTYTDVLDEIKAAESAARPATLGGTAASRFSASQRPTRQFRETARPPRKLLCRSQFP